MDRGHTGKERTGKRLVIFVFLLSCFCLYAQDSAVQTTVDKTSLQVNENFQFTIFIPEISPSKLTIEEPEFSDGIEIVTGPYTRPIISPGRNGSVVDYTFKLNKAGRYIIESFTIKSGNKVMRSTPVFLTTIQAQKEQYGSFDQASQSSHVLHAPPSVRWDIPKDIYYPGEIVPLRFAIENIENTDLIIESAVSQKTDGYVKKISRTSEKYEKTIITKKVLIETGEIYDLLFHDHIFVPFRAGNIILPDAEVYFSEGDFNYKATLQGIPVSISAIPEAEVDTGALGDYSYEYEISDNKISNLKAVILKQRITGTGNFYGIKMPAPQISDPEIADISLVKDVYNVTLAGDPGYKLFKGSRELIYSIRIKIKEVSFADSEAKNISVMVPDFSWFQKNTFDLSSPAAGNAMESTPEKSPGTVFILELEKIPLVQSTPGTTRADSEQTGKNLLEKIKIIFIIFIVTSLFFVVKKRIKKSIIVLLIIVLSGAIVFFVITKVLIKQPVYGIVNDLSSPVSVYVIPETEGPGAVKFSVENGETVRIIGEKDRFYLIETSNKLSRGWIKKENIIME